MSKNYFRKEETYSFVFLTFVLLFFCPVRKFTIFYEHLLNVRQEQSFLKTIFCFISILFQEKLTWFSRAYNGHGRTAVFPYLWIFWFNCVYHGVHYIGRYSMRLLERNTSAILQIFCLRSSMEASEKDGSEANPVYSYNANHFDIKFKLSCNITELITLN